VTGEAGRFGEPAPALAGPSSGHAARGRRRSPVPDEPRKEEGAPPRRGAAAVQDVIELLTIGFLVLFALLICAMS
jgi:hypothetical protein